MEEYQWAARHKSGTDGDDDDDDKKWGYTLKWGYTGVSMYQNQHTGNRYNGNNQCQPAEPSVAINRASQSVIMKKESVLMDVATPGEKGAIKK